jgi:YVTN family beta-propeller protein
VKTDSIQRIDPKTNKLVATITVPVGVFLLAAGGGSVWAANADENRLYRIDPKQNAVAQTIQTVQPAALAFGAGALWVLDASDGVVNQFDPGNGAATGTVRLPPGSAPGLPVIMRAGAEGVWVQWPGTAGNAVRIDPGSTAARPVTIGSPPLYVSDFAPVGPILWSLAPDPELPAYDVVRIDLRKPEATPTVINTDVDFGLLAADRGGAWLAEYARDRVLHIDARTGRLDRTVAVGRRPGAITVGEGAVWVVNTDDGTVSRIDPATSKVVATVPIGPGPAAIVAGAGGVWVDVHPH